jgi:AraC-like DNA-binding protein
MCKEDWQNEFFCRLAPNAMFANVFDQIPNVVFSVKDREGRYVLMSQSGARRCGLMSKRDAIGMTAFDLFPAAMAQRYAAQDEQLFRSSRPIVDRLDLTVYPGGDSGWCLTNKEPLCDRDGCIIGLACLSRDLCDPGLLGLIDADFSRTIDHIHAHIAEPLRVEQLARMSGLSLPQFERRMKKLFQLSAGQYLLKMRIDAARKLLCCGTQPIAEVAQLAGFCDQSALSRHFRQATGLSPRQYRQMVRR